MKQGMKNLERILKQGEKNIQDTLGYRLKPEIDAFLGNPSTQDVYFDDANTLVYVHGFGEEPNSTTVIPVGNIAKNKRLFGQPIIIKETVNGYRFIRVNDDLDTEFSEGTNNQQDNTPVYLSQLAYGTIHPYAALQVIVKSAVYDGVFVPDLITDAFDGTALDTLSNPVQAPTTNNRAIAVLIQLDAATDTLEYKQSTEFNAALSLEQVFNNDALPLADTGRYRVGYVKLTKGISSIGYAEIYNAPELFNATNNSAPSDATYIVQTSNSTLSNEQALASLATGFMKSTTTTGVISTQAQIALGSDVSGQLPVANGGTGASLASSARANLGLTIGSQVQSWSSVLDDIVGYGAIITKIYTADLGTNQTTTSTTFGNVTNSNISHTFTRANAIIRTEALLNNTGNNDTTIRITVNGNVGADSTEGQLTSNLNATTIPVAGRFTSISTGSPVTVQLQMKVSAGTGAINARQRLVYTIIEYN